MSVIKELKLPDDLGQGNVIQLLEDIKSNFSDDESNEYEESYNWALSRAIGSLRSDINFYQAQAYLLDIMKNSDISDLNCRELCIKYLECRQPAEL
jgi:hypothetical protein